MIKFLTKEIKAIEKQIQLSIQKDEDLNKNGFVATWFDTNDSNVYASFYTTPSLDGIASNPFALRLYQKYNSRISPI